MEQHTKDVLAFFRDIIVVAVALLGLWVAIIAAKHEGADMSPVLTAMVCLGLGAVLVWIAYRNLRDAHRATELSAQIVTIKDESETQIAHYKALADQEKQKAAQADRERSEAIRERSGFQGRANDANQKLGGANYLIEQQIDTIHRLEGALSEHVRIVGAIVPEKTPDRLRGYVSTLAGNLCSILIEIGEKLEAPMITSDRYMEALLTDPDPRVTTRASERKISDRLKDAYLCARDIGVLPECVSWETSVSDAGDVRSRIRELQILSEALMRRFPDVPTTPADL